MMLEEEREFRMPYDILRDFGDRPSPLPAVPTPPPKELVEDKPRMTPGPFKQITKSKPHARHFTTVEASAELTDISRPCRHLCRAKGGQGGPSCCVRVCAALGSDPAWLHPIVLEQVSRSHPARA